MNKKLAKQIRNLYRDFEFEKQKHLKHFFETKTDLKYGVEFWQLIAGAKKELEKEIKKLKDIVK